MPGQNKYDYPNPKQGRVREGGGDEAELDPI